MSPYFLQNLLFFDQHKYVTSYNIFLFLANMNMCFYIHELSSTYKLQYCTDIMLM